jgi:hypothetical protein
MTAINYCYNRNDPLRPFTREIPANSEATLPPAGATRSKPVKKAGHWPCWNGTAWMDVEDHRGDEGFVNGQPTKIESLGPYPEGWSATRPEPTPEELKEIERARIMGRLAEIDRESIRPLRAAAEGAAAEFDHQKLAALESEAAQLRGQLAGLEE